MDTAQFKQLQAKLESIWNEDSLIINDAPVEEAEDTKVAHDLGLLKQVSAQIAQDAVDNDYTAIDELLKNVTTSEMQGFLSEMESTVEEETEVAEAVKGPGVDAINDLLDMGVSKEDLFDQMMRDHSDDELMSFADDYRRMNDMGSDIDPDDDNSNVFQQSNY